MLLRERVVAVAPPGRGGHPGSAGTFGGGDEPVLSGFNTNIRHRGVLFHVQTEDSGRAHPHVISHVYHGGTILSSEKRGYAALLGAADLVKEVKGLMEAQHKSMLKRLRAGEFDGAIQQRLPGVFADLTDTAGTTQPEMGGGDPGAGGPGAGDPGAPPRQEAAGALPPAPRSFGDGVISQKPLDEVVLDYLVESARKRKPKAP